MERTSRIDTAKLAHGAPCHGTISSIANAGPSSRRPQFSVVIPIFNRAHLLERVLHSVLLQSCQDFEILVVDDGSTDDPVTVLKRLGDDRIRFLEQNHKG